MKTSDLTQDQKELLRQSLMEYLVQRRCAHIDVEDEADLSSGIHAYVSVRYVMQSDGFRESKIAWLKPRIKGAYTLLKELAE